MANNPITATYKGCAITLQDVGVFMLKQENTLIVAAVILKYSDFLISCPI